MPRQARQTRTQYRRLVDVIGPTGPALTLLSLLLDLAKDYLNDVDVTQEQLAELWAQRLPAEGGGWGSGVSTVRRATRDLEQAGWVSLCDTPVPGGGARHLIKYRLHIPGTRAVGEKWSDLLKHTKRRQAEAVSGPRSAAAFAHDGRPVVPPATGAAGEAVAELDPVEELPGGAPAAFAVMRRRLRGPP